MQIENGKIKAAILLEAALVVVIAVFYWFGRNILFRVGGDLVRRLYQMGGL